MVMHARKPPRINDGFPEKHQTHSHGYENSKYSKYRYGNHEKSRDSPSTNSLRSSSPDSRSQSPRYHKSNYYKVREKDRERDRERENRDRERERDRERDYKDYRDRDNSRSPKDRRSHMRDRERERDRERDHRDSRSMHDRVNSIHKKDEKERLMRVGDWSEHVSSSGKKYYYNCRTEVSQWEKPPEWLEWERNHRGSCSSVPVPSKESSISSLISHRGQHDKSGRQEKHSNLADGYRENLREVERDRRDYRQDERYDRRDIRKFGPDVGTADMEISSGDSTPTSESHHARNTGGDSGGLDSSGVQHPLGLTGHTTTSSHHPRLMKLSSSLGPLPASHPNSLPGAVNTHTTSANSNTHSSNNIGLSALAGANSSSGPILHNSHPRLMALSGCNSLSSMLESKGGGIHLGSLKNAGPTSIAASAHEDGPLGNKHSHSLEPLTISANSNCIGAGPPTPTHSENQDCLDIRKIGSPNSSLNSLQSLSQAASNSTNSFTLTPSLGNYYKDTLISHVQGWPAESIEKQCQRTTEEAHTIGSLMMTKVSAELKMARSLVRLAEIQATLHEQRILFLSGQQRELEDIKAQNCFMNDT